MKNKISKHCLLSALLTATCLYIGVAAANGETRACWPKDKEIGKSVFGWSYDVKNENRLITVYGLITSRYNGSWAGLGQGAFMEDGDKVTEIQGSYEVVSVSEKDPTIIKWGLSLNQDGTYKFISSDTHTTLICYKTDAIDAYIEPEAPIVAKSKPKKTEYISGSAFGAGYCARVNSKK